ncbi:hypothetical protein [Myxococcus hansupus]|uniref:hypothetical protein n=1 Tax=Pseudomyxococcus hansupus TaxID=1297742 RepID=UPI000AFA384E|nr:hypothetical protein [Myxococcus hansupus]
MKAAWSAVLALAVGLAVGCGAGVVESDGADESLTTSEAALAVCGDGICELGERRTCPSDCPQGEFCGNGACCPGETARSCPQDCTQGDPGQFCYRSH